MVSDAASRVERQRRRSQRGTAAERLAEQHLEEAGMQVLARNVRVGRLEIDLVAREADVVVIVEVRSRRVSAYGSPFRSVGWRKARRVRIAGEVLWRTRFRVDASLRRMRFDVVAVTFATGHELVEHVRAAF